MLTSSDIDALEQQLYAMRRDAIAALRTRLAGADADQPGSLERIDGEGGPGTDAAFTETEIALVRHELGALREIDDALKRIEFHVYGICTGCGRDIPIARLRAVPVAATCTECATLQTA